MMSRFRVPWRLLSSCLLLLGLFVLAGSVVVTPSVAAEQTYPDGGQITAVVPTQSANINWCVAGDFNSWNNTANPLFDDGTNGDLIVNDGLFSLDLTVGTAGFYAWKVVECGNWGNAYPAANSWLQTSAANQVVKLTFDTNDHSTDAGRPQLPAQNIVNAGDDLPTSYTAVGDFQGWNNADPATQLTHLGNGVYRLAYDVATPGSYSGKVTTTGTWNAFGGDGRSTDAANVNFTTTVANETVIFLLDSKTGRLTISPNGSGSGNWCVAGDFNGWNNTANPLYDDGSNGDLLGGDGVFTLDFTIAAAGRNEWKVVECGNWAVAFPADNAWTLTSTANQTVKFTFDTNDHSGDAGLSLIPAQNIVNAWDDLPASFTAVGPWQGWDNGSPASTMTALGNNYFLLNYTFASSGIYEGKISQTGNWDNQFGADGRNKNAPTASFEVYAANDVVQFWLDGNEGRWAVVTPPPPPSAGHDNDVWWNDLGHDSRNTLYRTPGGPVTTDTAVTLRLRAASGDLTDAKVRLYNDRPNTEQFLNMTLVADDGTYEWWEAQVPASTEPTVYWYRFIAIDGTATAYYEDDAARDQGWGQTFGDSPDNSWQITVYDPAFQTPDWVKNGIMYQIFGDRFRDGDPGNNTPAGTFFYNESPTIVRSNDADGNWNTVICDPRDATSDCPGIYSQNFYGGDLQGVLDELDYLQNLGVTVIYFNPIFESPSNHKYDTTDYSLIDDNFGDEALFQTLVDEAHARGMKVVLDGVFNHTSSDSIYFDRYGRYPDIGACESETSPYRGWYYFTDVTPGTGPCVGSDGTPNAATYESWFGFDSLPKLQAHNPDVRALIWDSADSIVKKWVDVGVDGWRFDVGGDVDPGVTNDPTNDYWEGFRAAYPGTYMVIEEWGNASPWLLGHEMDATMNYQYSSAMLSFWRDTTFTDNDHNSGSSAGELTPLTPSQLDARLHNWQERYPAEAYYAMMNLLDSHDTNRALFMLDENAATGTDATPLLDPNYDWSDAITRLKGVVLLQMTLPGAPTIYYGDEVGLVGPTYYSGGKWEDDPYNRQPYPWLDASGTPFYTHLQSQTGQDNLLNYYTTLTSVRNSHPALRTGSFDTLLVDDTAKVYAYGRLLSDYSDAAVVIVNRAGTAQDVTVDVSGYLPTGASFTDALNGGTYTVDGSGLLTVTAVPGMNGAVLVAGAPLATPPAAVADLMATTVTESSVDLSWSAAAGASSYDVYRSLVSGGGYEFVDNTTAITFSDTGVNVTTDYYYVVVSRDDTNLLASGNSNEVAATPAYTIGWANLQWPPSIDHTISAITRTGEIYGQIYIDGVTSTPGATPGLLAQVGFGSVGSTPDDNWTWEAMTFNVDSGNNDEFMGTLLPDTLGTYCYTTRYSGDGGHSWFYAVNGPDEGNTTCPGPFGVLTVVASADTTAPAAPANLTLTGTTNSSISLAWDAHPNSDGDLFGFEVYRENVAVSGFVRVATIADPAAVAYTDTAVTTGETYNYYVVAFDDSYNRSVPSNTVQATAEPRFVSVTFTVGVPAYTPGTVYLVGDIPELGPWNPGLVPMTQVDATTWTYTMDILDGTQLQYKYTRGTWDKVESWGSIVSTNNRSVTISYGTDGTQLVDNTATDWGVGPDDEQAVQYWRDPIVVDYSPADGAVDVPLDTAVTVAWSVPMEPDTTFVVEGPDGPVAGTFAYDDVTQVVTFTPDADLADGTTYTVTVDGAVSVGVPGGDSGVLQAPVVFSFTTHVITVEERLASLKDMVNGLVDDGLLAPHYGRILLRDLQRAERFLGRDHWVFDYVAAAQVRIFIQHVEVLVKLNRLPAAEGQMLIDEAWVLIGQLLNG